MRRKFLVVAALSTLAACGVDGEPITPTVSGAVTISDSGVFPSVGVGLYQSPFSLNLGFGR